MSQQINLYSPIFRKQTKVFSATTMLQGLGLIVLVVAVFYYYMSAQSSLLELRAAESGRQLKSELERLKVYGASDSPAERVKALAERKKALEDTLASQGQALQALKEGSFGRNEGYSGMLRALARVSVEGVWLTRVEFSEGSGELSLAGRALRADLVPAYLARLRAESSLRKQEFARLEVTRATPTFVEFTLSGASPKAR
ncbi:MAG TPA: PilN domain-containing protein [Burkholderiales bacterium]|nr:PilN domain-containing protein [Burkholderiales bacterium]